MFHFSDKTVSILFSILIINNQFNVITSKGCLRIPSDRTQIRPTPSNGNFIIRFSDSGELYQPGKQYTGKLYSFYCF